MDQVNVVCGTTTKYAVSGERHSPDIEADVYMQVEISFGTHTSSEDSLQWTRQY